MNDAATPQTLATIDPAAVKRIHVLGVAGTGMGSFAGMLKAAGYAVTGSDENVYPPMSDMLKAWGISVMTPYAPGNLDAARPDLVVVGNVIRQVNPEATAMRERQLPHMSFPAALGSFFLGPRHSIVVAGTHGKTTTSAMMGHVLVAAGKDPSFLVGGVTLNSQSNYRLGQGAHFVVEGDEYDTAYFDKGPKFLHYQPKSLILTSVEFDHADIYRDLPHYESSFIKLAALMPRDGFIAVAASYPNAVRMAREAKCPVATYSRDPSDTADLCCLEAAVSAAGTQLVVRERGGSPARLTLGVYGLHNVENALGVVAVARHLGLSFEAIDEGLRTFKGVRRRQELRGEPAGVAVVDDFAHHPRAVSETIAAVKARFPGRALWAVFEPRSNTSRRNIHQEAYAHAFGGAARVVVKTPAPHDKIPAGEGLSATQLATDIEARGISAVALDDVTAIATLVASQARSGDVVLVMSNGSFGGLVELLFKRLEAR